MTGQYDILIIQGKMFFEALTDLVTNWMLPIGGIGYVLLMGYLLPTRGD